MRRGSALLLWLVSVSPARADVLPEPEFPRGWEEHRPPQPAPPPEKELPAVMMLGLAALGLAAVGVAMRRRSAGVAVG